MLKTIYSKIQKPLNNVLQTTQNYDAEIVIKNVNGAYLKTILDKMKGS